MPGRAMLGPMSRLSVLGVQLDCVWEDKAANFKKVEALLEAQPPAPGALLVLPEMFATGFSCDLNQTAEPHGAEPTLAFLRGLAARWQCAALGGLVVRGEDGLARNQALALAPDGRELARYSKMRPFSAGGEAAVHARGESPVHFEWGGLRIAPKSTWGHSKGGISYVVTGLAKPLVVVGDALFASSMGGGMVSFADALSTNRKELFTLPDETIVCPGHGPLTTIGEEKAHNPFYPEFK